MSGRKQRYEAGVIKEGDLEILLEDFKDMKRPPRLPTRVVLNNRTISIFQADHYESIYMSFELSNLDQIQLNPIDPESCFILKDKRDPSKKITLCAMQSGKLSAEEELNNWTDAIYLFKEKFAGKKKFVTRDGKVDAELQRRRKTVEVEIREQEIERRDNERDDKKEGLMEKQIQKVSQMAYAAVQKELKFEEMLEHEEMLRQQEEEKEMQAQVAKEEEKEVRFLRDFQLILLENAQEIPCQEGQKHRQDPQTTHHC